MIEQSIILNPISDKGLLYANLIILTSVLAGILMIGTLKNVKNFNENFI